ncbi:hypothetical protein F5B22DRAFT_442079 [Xylaria bambusicola]|uniref:uncharacterized protein n=1 Tax=Xylaria bambusicola TaxID=326684 RepID=UPI0020087E4F|nr:uncharacterized protein F5B22DRAFT_442079 [Xylaria bambusicola]KAI0506581.1 hypothetical protein F5B22DRAFT_442079 [Xylaria bambusicola]
MGKITKVIQPKHKETLTPWLQDFVESATSKPLPLLPQVLATFPSRWPFPRGDLYHWIPLLNRFDELLELFNTTYKLNEGSQSREFGCEVLLKSSTELGEDERRRNLVELGYQEDGDVYLIESILKFTQMLLDHCGNRSIYASSAHLNDLLNSTDYRILIAVLRVGVELAQRYQASVKRIHGMATRQVHSALLSNHYNIDLDRVQQIAQPFVKTPIVRPSESGTASTPSSASKSKEKSLGGSSKNVATMFANDLCAIVKPEPNETQEVRARWNGWADVKLTYYPSLGTVSQEQAQPSVADRGIPSTPSTPTPLRRSNSANTSHVTPRTNRQGFEDTPGSVSRSPAMSRDDSISPGQKVLEVPQSAVISSSLYHVLGKLPKDLPKETRYEFLNRLRVAKALTGSTESRQQALKARLLAIQNLAYIHVESVFIEKVLRHDSDEPRRFQLIYQLAELIRPSADGSPQVPLDLQSIALSLLEAISSFQVKMPDIFSALNATVNHGVLLYVIKKAVAEMKEDDVGEQWTLEDEWRDNLFSLTLHITMAMAAMRSTPEIISAGLLDILVEILNLRSSIAERTHGTLVGFLDSLVYNVVSSFQSLAAADGLEAITNLITHEVNLAKQLAASGKGTPSSHRSQVVDYEIPFYQQQNLKFLLKFIHHVMTNAFAVGGNTDRLLRNLVDKSELLHSIRDIIENVAQFGSLVWTNAVTILGDFLNNDPTSFSAVLEAGLINSYLFALTGRHVTTPQSEEGGTPAPSNANENDDESSRSSSVSDTLEPDTRPHPPPQNVLERSRDHPLAGGIVASAEPISTVPVVLNAICLNNVGMKMVVSSGTFESFFEIFETPDHVRAMAAEETLAQSVGSSFDELARHHPSLRPAISNAVLDMIARVTHLARMKARDSAWGAKLVVRDSEQRELVADDSLLGFAPDVPEKSKANNATNDSGPHIMDIDVQGHEDAEKPSDPLSVHTSICPYIDAVAGFLTHYISNQSLKTSLITNGGIELLLDLYTSPSLPYTCRGTFITARGLQSVLSSLMEASPIIGLPSLLKRTQDAIDVLNVVVKSEDSASYFKPFLTQEATLTANTTHDLAKHLATGTSVVKSLLNAQLLMRVLYHSFPFSSRSQTLTLHGINVFDYHSRLLKSLGPLVRAVVLEEIAMSDIVPQQWYGKNNENQGHQAAINVPKTDDQQGFNFEDVTFSGTPSSTAVWQWATGNRVDRPRESPKPPQSNLQYRNYQTIKGLFEALIPTAFSLLQAYGKSLLGRRERDMYVRSHHAQLAEDISLTVLQQLQVFEREGTARDLQYWYIMLHAAHEVLVNPTAEGRSERGIHAQNIIPVLLAFKKHNGLKQLNAMLHKFKDEVCNPYEGEDGMARSRLASLGLKKILDIYAMLVNGKLITEAVANVNVLSQRATSSERRPDMSIAPNLVVEFRATILPVIQELWESPLIEKGSRTIVAKTIEILKAISSADAENGAYKRSDKNMPPTYLEPNNVKFPWSTHMADVNYLCEGGTFSKDLALEATYRSFGNRQLATEYCSAHEKEIAGTGNPIPSYDAPSDSENRSPAERTAQTEEEAMVLDSPADVSSGILDEALIGGDVDEIRNAAALSSGAGRETPLPSAAKPESNGQSTSASTPQNSAAKSKTDAENDTRSSYVAKEDLDQERVKLRSNLIDRCLDVIGAHPGTTYEVSELISSVVFRSPGDDTSAKQEIGETLVNALMSFAMDDDLQAKGRSIAAYAHLLSLLLQDKPFLKANVNILKENVGDILRFLHVSGSSSTEELSPWIPYVLLIFEILLSDDEQIGDIHWKAPDGENDPIQPLEWVPKDLNVKEDDRRTLLSSILEILPRIGREESLAVSVLRILVILTRDRAVARQVGDKKNLQRLFVTAKQLSGAGALRLGDTRISSYILTILRHVVEDEEVIKQIMRSEIRTHLDGARNPRPLEPIGFLRHFSHLVLRDPKLFVEVCSELVKLNRWTSRDNSAARHQVVLLKDPQAEVTKDEVGPTVRATEDLSIQDIKPSTEGEDKQMEDVSKTTAQDMKRPVVETPDGVIHFLLCELLNYKEVDDKDVSQLGKDSGQTSEQSSSLDAANDSESRTVDGKDKKGKSSFKADEHPIFIYRCFLLHCLSELLRSYNRTKIEFINFKRNAPLFANTPVKPRSSVLNYLLTDLLYPSTDGHLDTIVNKKRHATGIQTQNLLVALVTRTGEKPVDRSRDKYDYEDEPDLLFVRRFVLDTILKSYKDATTSTEPFDSRYARMLCLGEVMHLMMGEKDKDSTSSRSNPDTHDRSHAQLRRLMYEKGYLAALTTSIADIDLAFPPVKKTIKYILRVLRVLTSTAIHLSHSNIISSVPAQGNVEDELISTSSLSDIEDDREETPDLYRNSALGMHEPLRDMNNDYSEDSEDDDDEEMYDDEYDDDMAYESEDREEDVSDREEEDLEGMGPIEGLPGEPNVIEVTMEDDDDDVDEMDEDDEEEDESDEEEDSDEMDDVGGHIEIVDDEGNPLDDDGASDWESDPEGGADEEAGIEFDPEGPGLQEADIHLDDVEGLNRFGEIMRAIGDGDFEPIVEDLPQLNDRYIEEDEDDEEDDDDEDMDDEYAYEEEYPNDPPPRDIVAPSLGWDTVVLDHGGLFGGRRRHPPIDRQPMSLPFMMPQREQVHSFTDPRMRAGQPRDARMPSNEDGINPLLRRTHGDSRDASPRPSNFTGNLLRLGLPNNILPGHENPASFFNELMASLPLQFTRNGHPHALHFSFSSRAHMNEIPLPFTIPSRETRSDNRRDLYQEPIQATSFSAEHTVFRWTEEMKMIFGSHHQDKAGKLLPAVMFHLVPPAIVEEKRLQAEKQRIEDAERKKREEEERKAKEAREAKEAEEKAAREQKEAEERERAAEAAAAAAAEAQAASTNEDVQDGQVEPDVMEGVEPSGETTGDERDNAAVANQARSFTTIRGEQVDITELGIDPDYLEALPEEFREEVIAQTVSSRRAEAREATGGAGEQTEIFQEFLDALPEEIREEIVRQEGAERRRRDREEARRQATAAGQAPEAQDMDPASILMSFDEGLRDEVLLEQPEIMDSLPPDLALLVRPRQSIRTNPIVAEERRSGGVTRGRDTIQASGPTGEDNKPPRKAVVQMLDKAGVATLLRLMFINMKGGSIENPLKNVIKDVCENRQNRLEVISTLLQILQDGSTDMDAVERSFTHLSIRAKQPKDKEGKTQTPQGLKRTSTNINNHQSLQTTSDTSPLLIVQQCLDLLCFLADQNVHVPSLFLTEHDVVVSSLKRSLSRKGKGKESKAQKYAINSLTSLLDRDLVMESSSIMDSLSQLLSRVTFPLLTLDRKQKEAKEAIKLLEAENAKARDESAANQTTTSGTQPPDQALVTSENTEVSNPSDPSNDQPKAPTALEKKQAALKKINQLHPPIIPDANLTLIIKIFVARECSSKTFKETLSTIKNLSVIPGAMLVFGQELARQAQVLSEKIVVHLDELLPHIQSADTGTEVQGVALAKFSPGASDQNKLLRVLTALDHLFAQKKPDTTGESSVEENKKQDLLSTLYRNPTFNALWGKLSACLSAIRQRESLLNVATILLPLIEALMVVCKDSAQAEANASISQTSKDMVLSSPQPESRMAGLFFTFTEDHRRILNELVRNNPSLMKGTFSHLVKNPKVLEFDNKRNWFNRSVHNKQQTSRQFPTLQLQVRREHVFHDSFKSLYFKSGDEMKFGKLNIRFHGEEGVDAGGVTREWFQVLARQMFDANYALFVPVSSDRTTFHPNKLSGINDEHLSFFKFIGRIIGKALYEGRLLDCYFSRAVYKRILGKPVSVKDMESFDPEYYKSLSWMLNNDITDIITETFSVEDDEFGVTKVSDLCENGRNIPVTEENKHDYVRLVVEHKLLSSVKEQMENFLKGFHDIIPAELISIFNEQELELLISGLPDVDIDDWKSNTEYHNYTPSSPQIQWFWRALRSFDKEEVAKLLQFVTGTSKVPLNGFKELEGMNGINRFNIHRDYGNKDRLPSSHTCFNQLDLPEYESYEALRRQLLKAITAGSDYFGFA